MSFIVVMARLYPKEGTEENIIPLAESLVEETLKEEGNIDYTFLKSVKDSTFIFLEEWKSVEALSKHLASPHFKLFSKESADYVEDMEIKVLSAEELNLYE
ncbi:putative quinol monooxygenase [Methanobrevibacter olleyae]|uniref:ABM family protein n=1 Tax=Methanobrevibacter olleyae TaxID=294671 RepID=A0A126QY59_METOL|nr:putative quinol monooxygenase [Methanobrevibacter olleyae]AMK15093.1 ABM family protein [Methanobrevibacter olleyae]SFL76612.1 Quinol monooxygenase YgiN [Methanobrevibacter olleyae]